MICSRRIVLLAKDGATVEHELERPAAADMLVALRKLSQEYPGRFLAGEWEDKVGWRRFLIVGFEADPFETGKYFED